MVLRNHIKTIFLIIFWNYFLCHAKDCPPMERILPCRCAQKGDEMQIWCSHSNLPQVLEGIKSVARIVKRPIDELILENNQLPALPGRFFSSMLVTRLMLRHNNLERLSNGWLNDLENHLVEIFIVENQLRSIPLESLNGFNKLEAITIHSDYLKRLPDLSNLLNLKYLSIQSSELMELQPQSFRRLPSLETIKINGGRGLNRLEAGLFNNLPSLKVIDLSRNGINWIHLRALYRLPRLTTLKLSGNELTDVGMVGRAIKDLENLQKLRLDKNYINLLSEGSFVDLPLLRELHLNDNRITEIHYGAFTRTPNLRLIYLQNNLLKRIHPESFLQSSGSGIEIFYIQNNEIDRVEELRSLFDALPTLKFLDMSNNYIREIPFGALRGHGTLEQLHLDSNLLEIIDRDALMAMPGLRELRLRNNSLSDILQMPFWNLPGLKGLDLSLNKFNKVDSLLLTGVPSLRRLDMSQNYLTTLDPSAFLHTPMLETLNVSFNLISFVHPATFRGLDRLFEIDASNNRLTDMMPGLPNTVERISVRNNDISTIPVSSSKFFNLPNLRMLDISSNKLEYIPNFTFQALKQLRVLSMAKNRLRAIEDSTLSGADKLEMLHLQDNQISNVQDHSLKAMNSLRDINLQGNKLEMLTDNLFANTTNMEQLDLSRNSLRELTPMIFKNLNNLKYLDLSGNLLIDIPNSLSLLSNLRDIDVSSNRLTYLPPEVLGAWKNIIEIRLSNNQILDIKHGTLRNLPKLQYLDLSSNEINTVERGSLRNLPDLQELVLADNKLVELKDRVFEELPNLQAAHLQHNLLRFISPQSFYKSPSLVYLNLSANHFRNLENVGLRHMRNLEVLDVSNNGVKTISTMPLQALNWLVELKMDNNQICKVQGEPFVTMPRLRVLSMRNNRMKTVSERAFRNLRGNIAILDIDGNPISCSCEMLWLSVWLDETNSPNPGPRCQNGKMLRSARLDRNDCENIRTSNHLPLINDHGDVFVRQLSDELRDDCEPDLPDDISQRPLPGESEYFYDQFIDYPFNDSHSIITNNGTSNSIKDGSSRHPPVSNNNIPNKIDLNNTILNYNIFRPRPQVPESSSAFTFFGYPLPSINVGRFFGRGRLSDGRSASHPSRGKFRMYRPNDAEIEKFLNQESQYYDVATKHRVQGLNSGEVQLSEEQQTFRTPFKNPSLERGGFSPMVPGSMGGFVPINNPFDDNNNSSEKAETIENPMKQSSDNEPHYEKLIPIVTEISNRITKVDSFNSTTTTNSPDPDNDRYTYLEMGASTYPTQTEINYPDIETTRSAYHVNTEDISVTENFKTTTVFPDTIEDPNFTTETSITITSTPETILLIPPSSEEEINSKKIYDRYWETLNHSSSSRSALVAPGSRQQHSPSHPPIGRPTITKVFPQQAANLPTAEEFFRTTTESNRESDSQLNSYMTISPQTEQSSTKQGMDWYYESYKKNSIQAKSGAEYDLAGVVASGTSTLQTISAVHLRLILGLCSMLYHTMTSV